MQLTRKTKYILLVLLVVLNLILRYPATPHEIGWDSFNIHAIANTISIFGEARWWIHPLSVVGLYPYSYSSAVPFILSGISQVTGIGMENTVWIFATFIGLLSMFIAYILAGKIIDDDIFRFIFSFCFSTSMGVLYFSTWTVSTRGLFVVLFPLFLYLLLKLKDMRVRGFILMILLFSLLVTIHKLFYFLIPVVIAYCLVLTIFKIKINSHIHFSNKANIILVIGFAAAFIMPFLLRMFIRSSSRYSWLYDMGSTYLRLVGLLGIFAIGGFIYLISKNKNIEEWIIIISALLLTPIIYVLTYAEWVYLTFILIFAGLGFSNAIHLTIRNKNYMKQSMSIIIIMFCLFSVGVSEFYQVKSLITEKHPISQRYMEESEYITSQWVKEYTTKVITSNDYVLNRRVFANSEAKTLISDNIIGLIYGSINISEHEYEMRPMFSDKSSFFFDSPYIRVKPVMYTEQSWYWETLLLDDYDKGFSKKIIESYNLVYIIENKKTNGYYLGERIFGNSKFIRSLPESKSSLYDNGNINIWYLT